MTDKLVGMAAIVKKSPVFWLLENLATLPVNAIPLQLTKAHLEPTLQQNWPIVSQKSQLLFSLLFILIYAGDEIFEAKNVVDFLF